MEIVLPLAVFLVLGFIAVSAVTVRMPGAERETLRRILYIALALRFVTATLFELLPETRRFHEDADGYEQLGLMISEGWNGNSPDYDYRKTRESNYGYAYMLAGINYVLGPYRTVGPYANCVIGTITVALVYFLARRLFQPLVAVRTAKLIAYFPSMVLWSSLAIKDPIVTMLTVLALLAALRLKEDFNSRNVAIATIPLLLMQPLRFYIIYFVGLAILASMLIDRGLRAIRGLYVQVALGLVLVGLVMATGMQQNLQAGTEFMDLKKMSEFRRNMATTAQSGFAANVDISTPQGALFFLPIGMSVLLFGPFPWQMLSFRAALTLPEMLIWWSMIPALWIGLRYSIKHLLSKTSPVLFFTATLTCAYSLIQGNVGSGFRQRAQIFVFLFIFAALGHYLQMCRDRKLDEKMLLADYVPPPAVAAPAAPKKKTTAA